MQNCFFDDNWASNILEFSRDVTYILQLGGCHVTADEFERVEEDGLLAEEVQISHHPGVRVREDDGADLVQGHLFLRQT